MRDPFWSAFAILTAGVVVTQTLGPGQIKSLPLRQPLAELPAEFGEFRRTEDLPLSPEELRVGRMDAYLMRIFQAADTNRTASLYVGYYGAQTNGKVIHSPKNCLPGAGWEPVESSVAEVATPAGPVRVNRYVVQHGTSRALVYYWYQGRGRVEASEFRVKWFLLRDAAVRRRSDEALVRLVIPLRPAFDAPEATETALAVIPQVITAVNGSLPSS